MHQKYADLFELKSFRKFVFNIGDYESGIETLVGAISLIKQSPTAAEERCQVKTKCNNNINNQLIFKLNGLKGLCRTIVGNFSTDQLFIE